MKKSTLLMIVSVVLAMTLSLGGTLAYLKDSDSDVNVMTLGNVYIEQIEQERGANGELVEFKENKPAYPAVGPIEWAAEGVDVNGTKYKVFTEDLHNVVDKIVTVKNTGKSDAFVRTIVALEAPNYDPNDLIHVNVNDDDLTMTGWAPVVIDDVEYVYSVFTYVAPLQAGKISAPSLVQLFLDAKAENEDIALFGDTWEVLTLSQAVQAAGFESQGAAAALNAGFGEATAANVAVWFGEVVPVKTAATADELKVALENANGGTIVLANDIELTETINVVADVTIDLAGHKLNASANQSRPFEVTTGVDLTINANGGEVVCGDYGLVNVPAGVTDVTITLNGGKYTANLDNGAFIRVRDNADDVKVVLNNVDYADESHNSFILNSYMAGEVTLEINGGTYKAHAGFQPVNGTVKGAVIVTEAVPFEIMGNVIIDGCTITVDPGESVGSAPAACVAVSNNGYVTVKNSTLNAKKNTLSVYDVYTSGGTIVAENNVETIENGVIAMDRPVDLVNYPNAKSAIIIDGVTVVAYPVK